MKKIVYCNTFKPWRIEDNSVQAVITSHPYYQMRKYDIPDVKITNTFTGQYGWESSYQEYIAHTLLWIKEVKRVLSDDGIFFLNIQDKFSTKSGGMRGDVPQPEFSIKVNEVMNRKQAKQNLHDKTYCMIPERLAIAMVDDGWTLRNKIVWHKSNALPESVVDRFSKKYEHVFMFVKNKNYYFNLGAVKVPIKESTVVRAKGGVGSNHKYILENMGLNACREYNNNAEPKLLCNPGDVWTIPNQALKASHYASYPETLIERMILCSTKEGDTVLDPFVGSGRTLLVANRLGRNGIGFDLGYEEIHNKIL